MEITLKTIERKRVLLPLPFPLRRLASRSCNLLPGAPLTPDQVEMLKVDNVVSEQAKIERRTLEGLGIKPNRSPRSCRPICGAFAAPGSSGSSRSSRLSAGNRSRTAGAADHDPPPGEQREAVTLHVFEQRPHHDPAEDE